MSSSTSRLDSLTPEERKRLALRLRMRKAAEAQALAAASAGEGVEDRAGMAFPLTFQQQRLWLLDRMSPSGSAYNMPGGVRLHGPLDADALARAFQSVVRRHEVLRTRIEVRDGDPVQVVLPPEAFSVARVDLSHLGGTALDDALHDLASDEAARPFRLDEEPLARATIVRLGDDAHALLWTLHHIVSDGWSTGILLGELTAHYTATTGGSGAPAALPPLPVQYGDHARAQRERDADGEVAWWAERLRGAPHVLDLPTDRPHAAVRDPAAATVELELPPGTPERVARLGRQAEATPFMVYLSVLQLLLGRYARQDDFLIGTAVANRPTPELERLIGFFANTLVLRADLSGDPSYRQHLARVRSATVDAFDHQDVPFEKLVEVLNPERSLSHQPLVQVAFAFQNVPRAEGGGLPGVETAPLDAGPAAAKFDLSITFVEVGDCTWTRIEYAADVFDAGTVRRMAAHYAALLESVLDAPGTRLDALSMFAPGEREQVLGAWSEGPAVDAETTVTARFAAQVRRTPGATALEWADGTLSYADLDARAAALAARLRNASVGAEDRVGIFLRRGPDAVVAMLGVLRAGAAYVPLDPAYPAERLHFMARDAGLAAILTEPALRDRVPDAAVPVLDVTVAPSAEEAPAGETPGDGPDATSPDALAYVVYTSGSTGTPKGAAIPHRGIVRLVAGRGYARFGPDRAFLQLAPLSFDAATFEVWGALLNGGRLVIPAPDAGPVDAVRWGVRERGVTTLWLTAGLFHLVADDAPDALEGLDELLAGGDVLSPDRVRRVLRDRPGLRLVNGYGPTENTTFTTCATLSDGWSGASVPIGRPIGGTGVRILRGLEPVPAGVPGELYATGQELARGYHGRAALTAGRFLPDPHAAVPGARMYRTGDVARWRADGQVEFMGRADAQVKVRGFRIEPGEIEAALLAHPDVGEAAAIARRGTDAGEPRLLAYAVLHDGCAADGGTLRDWLAARLPDYMLPAAVIPLEALPLTPNGKLDHRALPDPAGPGAADGSAAPRTPLEEVAAGIWAEVLGVERIGRADEFFAAGGHSLVAARVVTRVRERLGVDIPLRALFEAPRLDAFAARLEAALRDAGAGAPPPLERVDGDDLPLSFAQERLWFIHRLDPASPAYNMAPALRFRGALDADALERALAGIVRRHESLRTHFPEVDGAPVQRVQNWTNWTLPREDVSAMDDLAREDELVRRATAWAWTPFDLERGPLFRARLLRLAGDDHALLVGMHHAVSDGWSMGIFFRELAALYAAEVAGEPPPLPALPFRYADFAAWQRAWLRGGVLERQIGWWRDRLAGAPPVLDLPTDRPRPASRDQRGAAHPFAVPAPLAGEVRALARREGATVFMVLLAAYQALLARYARQDDVVVGAPVAGRTHTGTEGLIGFFVNTLALRTDLSGNPSFRELVARAREATLGAYAHQDLPFEKLVEELQPERSLSHAPVFQAMFVLQNTPDGPGGGFAGLTVDGVGREGGVAKVDLTLDVGEAADGALAGALEYATDIFDAETVVRMAGHLGTLLAAAVAEPERRLRDLPLLPEEEEAWLRGFGAAAAEHPAAGTLHGRFAARAARTPDAAALTFGGSHVPYAELDRRANRLAHHLRTMGAGPERLVGLCVDRSPEAVVGILGILKAGAAYLPLDPVYPDERLVYVLEDSGVDLVLTDGANADRLPPAVRRLRLDDGSAALDALPATAPEVRAGPESLAYVIYTSGSTGRPKGVEVTHGNVLRLMEATEAWFGFGPDDVWTLFHSYAFDFSVWEIWGALLYGGRLVVVPYLVSRAPEEFHALLAAEAVTVLNQTPSAFRQLARADLEAAARGHAAALALRYVIFGGEALDPATLRGWVDRHGCERPRLVNMYGITETTVHVTWREIEEADVRAGGASPIGIPIPDLAVQVLDDAARPVPAGVPGEMYVGGGGVARGYLRRPALTAERFVPDPDAGHPGARRYRSGDLARRRPDGALEYVGRADDQVKIRGFRIELGEIEAVLLDHPEVREAVVLARDGDGGGDRRLVAYVVHAGAAPSPAGLREHLARRLPDYMVPAAFVPLERLPVTRNGKVDRAALPDPAPSATGGGGAAPRTPAEELLAGIWMEMLGVAAAGPNDDFFALGGHSLLATRVASRVRAVLGVELPLRTLFERPVLAALAAEVDRLRAGDAAAGTGPIVPVPRDGDVPVSFAQERLWFVDALDPGSPVFSMPFTYRVAGAVDEDAMRRALAALVARHEPLRTTLPEVDGVPVQRIAPPPADFALPVTDLRHLDEDARMAAAERLAEAAASHPFDLARGPLFRAALVRMTDREHLLLLNLHHAVGDGWSVGVLLDELSALYGAFTRGEESPLPPPGLQYADFAAWQRAWLTGDVLERQVAYWREKLAGAPALLEVPTDHPRPPVESHRGGGTWLLVPPETAAGVHALARREGATLFMVLLAALDVVLGRLAGQEDVVVGAPIAGRTRAETDRMVGLFLNSLALRTDLSGAPTFRELLGRVRETTLEAYAHQDVPFERLLEELRPARSLAHAPVFQVMLNLLNFDAGEMRAGDAEVTALGSGRAPSAKFDLTLYAGEADGGIGLRLVYAADLFAPARMEALLAQIDGVLRQAVADPDTPIAALPLTTPGAADVLPDPRAPLDATWRGAVHEAFTAHAQRTPDALAAEDPRERWTYGELDAASNRIARHLADRGVGVGDVVTITGHRSAALVRGLLGILKRGAAFLILDPAYPAARLAEYVRIASPAAHLHPAAAGDLPPEVDAALARILRTRVELGRRADAASPERDTLDNIDGLASVSPDPFDVAVGPDDIAYLAFTSGTTGAPKAVVGRHGPLTHFTPWAAETFGLGADDRYSMLSGLSHDPLHRDVFTPLQLGAAVVAPEPDEVGTPGYLAGWMLDAGITIAHLTPAMAQLVDPHPPAPSPPVGEGSGVGGTPPLREEGPHPPAPSPINGRGGDAAAGTGALSTPLSGEEPADAPRGPRAFPSPLVGEGAGVGGTPPPARIPSLRAVFLVGDVLRRGDAARLKALAPGVRVVNYYGSTETQRAVSYHSVAADPRDEPKEVIPLGRGIPGVQLLVRNAAGALCGVGEVGEIWLRSPHVAAGYLRDAALTAARFVTNPWRDDPADRLYRTGDLGRYRADGIVEPAGRADQQVKVRGFRIELGEVEAALLRHPAVREAAAVARDDGHGDRMLAAYWVPAPGNGGAPADDELRAHLRSLLPEFMIPAAYVRLERLPLTANGKLDRRALPDPPAFGGGERFVPPRTPAEEAVAAAWREVLSLDRIGVNDDFFALGGHSLRATQVLSRIDRALGVRLPVRAIFQAPTVAGLAAAVEAHRADAPAAASPSPALDDPAWAPDVHPVTFAQQRLWFVGQLESTVGYHLPVALRFRGRLDVGALAAALEEIVRRHEPLRSRIEMRGAEPVQVVDPPAPLRLDPEPVRAPAGEPRDRAFAARAGAEAARPFPPEGPFVRATLLRAADDDHVLLWTMHHMVADGWSIGIFHGELAALYRALARGEPAALPPLPTTYGEHARRQRRELAGDALAAHVAYWRERFAGAPAALELPTDRARPAVPSGRGAALPLALEADAAAHVAALARDAGVTPFMVLLAAFQLLLSRWSGQDDIVVGTPIANRTRPEVEPLIGYFANTLALRTDLSGDPSFRGLLARVRETTLGAYEHQDLPFEKLVEEIRPPRSLSHSPVFQVMFNLLNAPPGEAGGALEGVEVSGLPRAWPGARYDLTLSLAEAGGRYAGSVEYAADLFDEDTMRRMTEQLARLLAAAADRPDAPVSELDLLTDDDRSRVVEAWNRTAALLPAAAATADALIEAHARRTPEAPAVTGSSGSLTYGALLLRADAIAGRLRALGAGPETRVGLAVARGPEMIAAMLGVWRAGAAYVPLDPAHPAERLRYVMDDAGIALLVADAAALSRLPDAGVPVLRPEDVSGDAAGADTPLPGQTADALAYVIYTSGSTGRPKGVMVPHGALVAFLAAIRERPGMTPAETLLSVTTPTFDMSVLEFFLPLAAGAHLRIAEPDVAADGLRLRRLLEESGARVVMATPATWRMLHDAGWHPPRGMRAFAGGEALPPEVADALTAGGAELWNLYGPTETTVFSTVARIEPGDAPTLGRPIANNRVYVLDRRQRPAPVGVPGELFIGGAGVTRGYAARPALTAARYVPDPYASTPGARLYRTGDRARWLPDARLEYLGRLDAQVKVRGFRIEPGEVEAALAAHPSVRAAVVVAREDGPGGARLVAYVVPEADAAPDAAELRAHLRGTLPEYMVPSAVVALAAFPLTTGGKVDRRALPAPDLAGGSGEYEPPRTETEAVLAEVWREVLGVPRVGRADDFFALGGHSLLATRVAARIRTVLGIELPLRAVFEHPELSALAVEADRLRGAADASGAAPPIVPVPRGGDLPISFAQERLWFVDALDPGSPVYNIPATYRIAGPLDRHALARALAELVRRHEPLRTALPVVGGVPVQRILPPPEVLEPAVTDIGHLPEGERAEEARRLAEAAAMRPFDLARDRLFRAELVRLADDDHLLLLNLHHVVGDGWSMGVLLDELSALYGAFTRGEPSPLPVPPLQYADYAAWQRRWLVGGVLDGQLAYWRRALDGAPALLELPADRPRPPVQSHRGASASALLPAELLAEVHALARREGATLFMVLLAALDVVLGRLAGQEDVVVGTPVAGRTRAETERMVGLFLNSLALRTDLSGDPTFRELLGRVRETTLGAYAHQDVPFERLLEEIRPERTLAHAPVFQVMLNLLNFDRGRIQASELEVTSLGSGRAATAKFDLTLYAAEREDGLLLDFAYAADLFDAPRMRALLAQIESVLRHATTAPETRIGALPLTAEATAGIIPDPASPLDATWHGAVHEVFSRQARATPHALAAEDPDTRWTYAALDADTDGIAGRLADAAVGPGDVVAITGHRSAALVRALLGTMKSGAAFLVLDPAYPPARLVDYVRIARPAAHLHLDAAGPLPPEVTEALAATVRTSLRVGPHAAGADLRRAAPAVEVGPDALAYLSFTSGTTGTPKAVLGRHASLTHFTPWLAEAFELTTDDRYSLLSGLAHDPLHRDVFTPLQLGAAVVAPEAERVYEPGYLARWMRDARVTVTHLTPAMGQLMVDGAARPEDGSARRAGGPHPPAPSPMNGRGGGAAAATGALPAPLCGEDSGDAPRGPRAFPSPLVGEGAGVGGTQPPLQIPSLRRAFYVGDVLRRDDVARLKALAPGVRVVNYYGSTETQRAVSYHSVAADPRDEPKEVIPLGRGIPAVQLLVRNAAGALCGVGEVGEIWLRSPHVAAGYLGDAALTAARFVTNPWTDDPADRLYRTGDLGRYRADGTVEPAGRADQQVKVRGFRVELGEVESALAAHPDVRQAVVVARSDGGGDARLVAYWIGEAGTTAGADPLRAHLRERLPAYMVPSAFVSLEAFPLTGTGKVDRRALPAPAVAHAAAAYEPPRTEAEAAVAEVWAEVLGVPRVGRGDDFFALGGHSLLAVRLMARVQERTGRTVPLAELFRSPTMADFAAALERTGSSPGDGSPLVTLRAGGERPPLFCVHPAGGTVFRYAELARRLENDRSVHAFQAEGLADGTDPLETVEVMAGHYLEAMREARPQGPYVLGGWSAGGVVALEMAGRLRARGEAVPLLILFDAVLPRPERARPLPHDVELYCRFARDLAGADEARLAGLADELTALPEEARLRGVADWIARERLPVPDATLGQIGRTVRVFRATTAAVDAYQPAPYGGDVLLLEAAEGSAGSRGHRAGDLAEQWRRLVTGRLDVRTVPGTHAEMFSPPHVDAVARAVAEALSALN